MFPATTKKVDDRPTPPPPTVALMDAKPQGQDMTSMHSMQFNPCPWQGGDVLMNKDNGLMYVFSNGELHLVQTTEIFKQIGSPDQKMVSSDEISRCKIGKPLELQEIKPATIGNEEIPNFDETDRNVYVFVTEDRKNVLSVKFGSLILEKFRQKEIRQCFIVYLNGKIQNILHAKFVTENENCMAVELNEEEIATEFVFTPKAGGDDEFSIKCGCGYVAIGKQNSIILGPTPYHWKMERVGRF